MATTAPGTWPPVSSVTVPDSVAFAPCARAAGGRPTARETAATTRSHALVHVARHVDTPHLLHREVGHRVHEDGQGQVLRALCDQAVELQVEPPRVALAPDRALLLPEQRRELGQVLLLRPARGQARHRRL